MICEFSVTLGALLLLLLGLFGRGCSAAELALRALGSVWSASRVLWAGAEECCGYGAGAGILCLLPAARLMTSNDGNDLTPDQEKLEWVTPKISLMDAGDTRGKIPSVKELTVTYKSITVGFYGS